MEKLIFSKDYFESILHDDQRKWYLDEMDWWQLQVLELMEPEERKEYHVRLLEAKKHADPAFLDKLKAVYLKKDGEKETFDSELQKERKK